MAMPELPGQHGRSPRAAPGARRIQPLLAWSAVLAIVVAWRHLGRSGQLTPKIGRGASLDLAAALPGRGRGRTDVPQKPITAAGWTDLLASVDLFVFDCDGVIWRGDELIAGVKETLEALLKLGKRLVFVTNNSTRSRQQYAAKFRKLGLDFVTAENIFASSFAAAAYLQREGFAKKAYVIGEVGIVEELKLAGIEHIGGPNDADRKVDLTSAENGKVELDPDVGAVVVGFDRNLNYYKVQYATKCLREVPGCMFVATNRDAVTHLTADDEWAGGGAMVAAVQASSQRDPVLVGKPAQFMTEFLASQYGVPPDRMVMVGDRLDTDMRFGQAGGMQTLLVLSGVTKEADLHDPDNDVSPDYYAPSLGALHLKDCP